MLSALLLLTLLSFRKKHFLGFSHFETQIHHRLCVVQCDEQVEIFINGWGTGLFGFGILHLPKEISTLDLELKRQGLTVYRAQVSLQADTLVHPTLPLKQQFVAL